MQFIMCLPRLANHHSIKLHPIRSSTVLCNLQPPSAYSSGYLEELLIFSLYRTEWGIRETVMQGSILVAPKLKESRTLSLNIPENESLHASPPLPASPYDLARVSSLAQNLRSIASPLFERRNEPRHAFSSSYFLMLQKECDGPQSCQGALCSPLPCLFHCQYLFMKSEQVCLLCAALFLWHWRSNTESPEANQHHERTQQASHHRLWF